MVVFDCITAVICFVVVTNQSTSAENGGCSVSRLNKMLFADCRNLGLKEIPNNLTRNVQIMDISDNPIKTIKKDSFKEYPSLLNFTFTFSEEKRVAIDVTVFARISELRYIKMLNVNLFRNPTLIFPPTLIRLVMVYCSLDDELMNIRNLSKLKVLNLSYNGFSKIPQIHPNAPLRVISMYRTRFSTIDVLTLSKYCQLEALHFNVPDTWKFYQSSCDCLSIQKWLEYSNVKYFTNFKVHQCPSTEDGIRCANEMDKRIRKNYQECQNNTAGSKSDDDDYNVFQYEDEEESSDHFPLIVIIVGILIFFVIFIVIYKKKTRRRKKRTTSLSNSNQDNQREEEFEENTNIEGDQATE